MPAKDYSRDERSIMGNMVRIPTVKMSEDAIYNGFSIGPMSAHRVVYKTKYGKWVYKVVQSNRHCTTYNLDEMECYNAIPQDQLPDGVKLPKMYMLPNGVIAAEYISGKHPEYTGCDGRQHDSGRYTWDGKSRCPGEDKCWATKVIPLKLKDLHYQNVLVTRDGTVYLIDIDGGFYSDSPLINRDLTAA